MLVLVLALMSALAFNVALVLLVSLISVYTRTAIEAYVYILEGHKKAPDSLRSGGF